MELEERIKKAVREYRAEIQRRHMKNKKTAGKCGWSGCRNKKKVYYCYAHEFTARKKNRTRIYWMRDSRIAEGLCMQCRKPNKDKQRLCGECRVVRSAYMRQWRARRKISCQI